MDGNRGDFARHGRRRTSQGGPWGPLSPTRLVPQLLQSICQLLHSGDIHQPLQKLRMSSARSPAAFLSGRFKPHCADPHRRFSGGQVKSGGCWNKVVSSPPVQSLRCYPRLQERGEGPKLRAWRPGPSPGSATGLVCDARQVTSPLWTCLIIHKLRGLDLM